MVTRVGLVGFPVAHSRSPMIFGHWFERYDIKARYELLPVHPAELDRFFAEFGTMGLTGVNVTVPHKIAAAGHVRLDPVGARLNSINTVWMEDGALAGTSSDGAGFIASLDEQAPDWRSAKRGLVLGAGGASVAVCDALIDAGLDLVIVNRRQQRAELLAAKVGARAMAWDDIPALLGEADLLVNTTSLGMDGHEPLKVDLAPLPAGAVVADIVYNPLRTPLLEAAAARGLTTVDGLGMLIHQATVGFEKWFGFRPEVDAALRAKVVATL
ncbi:shikimate dehydrogenase [Acuticoccus yangtzensis]|uniref:shikimate dehydrogenase n=1 Tax=Acuticoccus yangtzensis TaxID=1443441 RepID=UPI000949ADF5|nr:shikimate dehydrogenase [Acuticoccus yangtzensis]